MLLASLALLRSRIGGAVQATRDDEEAARSLGVEIIRTKQAIYILAAFGCALAGVIWLASAVTFLPRTNFGVQWTVFMLFMVLVGGLRTMEGPILGALIFFVLQEAFGDFGVCTCSAPASLPWRSPSRCREACGEPFAGASACVCFRLVNG